MIETVKRVRCDHCGAIGPEVRTVQQVRVLVEVTGWETRWYGGDHWHYCPACVAKSEPRPLNPPRGRDALPVLDYLARTLPAAAADAPRSRYNGLRDAEG